MSITKFFSILSLLLWVLPQSALAFGPERAPQEPAKTEAQKEESVKEEAAAEEAEEPVVFVPFEMSLSDLQKYIKGFKGKINEDGTLTTFGVTVLYNLDNISVSKNEADGKLIYTANAPLVDMSKVDCKRMKQALIEEIGGCTKLSDHTAKSVFKLNPTKSKNIEIAYDDLDQDIVDSATSKDSRSVDALLDEEGKPVYFKTAQDRRNEILKGKKDEFRKLLGSGHVCATCAKDKEKVSQITSLYEEIRNDLSASEKVEFERKVDALKNKSEEAKFAELKKTISKERPKDSIEEREELLSMIAANPEKYAKEGHELLVRLSDKAGSYEDAVAILDDAQMVSEDHLEESDTMKVEFKKFSRAASFGKQSEEYKLARDDYRQLRADQFVDYGCNTAEADAICGELKKEAAEMQRIDQVATNMDQYFQFKKACDQGAGNVQLCASLPEMKAKILNPNTTQQATEQNPFLANVAQTGTPGASTPTSGAPQSGFPAQASAGNFNGNFGTDLNQGLFQNPLMPTQNMGQMNYANPIQNQMSPVLRVR